MRTARAGAAREGAARELLTRRRLDRVAKVTSRTATLPASGTGGGRNTRQSGDVTGWDAVLREFADQFGGLGFDGPYLGASGPDPVGPLLHATSVRCVIDDHANIHRRRRHVEGDGEIVPRLAFHVRGSVRLPITTVALCRRAEQCQTLPRLTTQQLHLSHVRGCIP